MTEKINRPTIRIAMSMVRQAEEYLFQRRSEEFNNGALGFTGCFGGMIEDGEGADEAVARELGEEISVILPKGDYSHKGKVSVESDRDGKPVKVEADVYEIVIEDGLEINAVQGELVRIRTVEVDKFLMTFTPATKAAIEKFYLEEN